VSRPITPLERMAGTTGLEPATSAVTGQRSSRLNYVPASLCGIRRNCSAKSELNPATGSIAQHATAHKGVAGFHLGLA
jgi:hypothetical protein